MNYTDTKSMPETWWNNAWSHIALEDLKLVQNDLPNCVCQTIGTALLKLEILENQGLKITEAKNVETKSDRAVSDKTKADEMAAMEALRWIREGYIKGCAGVDNRLRDVFKTIDVAAIFVKYSEKEIINKISDYELHRRTSC